MGFVSRIILPRAWTSEHVPAAVAMFDRDMQYMAVSRRWVADFGLRDVELHGRSHYDVFPDIPERWRLIHQRALAGEVQSSAEDRWDRGDGTTQWLRWECQPWPADNGSVGGILIFAEDITASKQAEEALRSSEQRKDELLATLAHELRNPLAPIRNGFELLRRGLVGEPRRLEVEAMIERQLGHLIRIIDDLLDAARIGGGVADGSRSTSVDQARGGSSSASGRRILVVDDNADGAETFAMLLELAGHQTRFAGSGPVALELARAFEPEVVFLDIGLPGMDGYEVARRLRAEPTTVGTMLVAVTGWGSEQDERRCLEAGFDAHLVKPVAPAVVAEVLARGRGGDDGGRRDAAAGSRRC